MSPELITAEVILKPEEKGRSVLEAAEPFTTDNVVRFRPRRDKIGNTWDHLKKMGFQILATSAGGVTIGGTADLFEKALKIPLKQKKHNLFSEKVTSETITYLGMPPDRPYLTVPDHLKDLVEGIVIPEPPIFFAPSPIPPQVAYHHLHPKGEVPMLLNATRLHAQGFNGRGIRVAMVDTGFQSSHPYYDQNGYRTRTLVAPDASDPATDPYGHGTGIAANTLGVAPAVSFVAIKSGLNSHLAFKKAVQQRPDIITNSWGYDIDAPGTTALPAWMKPLEIEIVSAVADGIAVFFAAGNGHHAWPGSMPDVISVGGAYFDSNMGLQASSYASSFDSSLYPGRHVPDICGLVGPAPKGIYIMMPTQAGSTVDSAFGGRTFPNGDQTKPDDGWVCASGTSSATPMTAGVAGLLLEHSPDLTPSQLKQTLKATAKDVTAGTSAMRDAAGLGYDKATGYGLVDAAAAFQSLR